MSLYDVVTFQVANLISLHRNLECQIHISFSSLKMNGRRRIVLDNYFDYRGVDDFWLNMSLAVYLRHFILQKRRAMRKL